MQGLHMARSPKEAAPRSSLLNSCDKHSDRVYTGWVPQGPYLIPAGKGESQVPAEPSSGSLCILKMAILYLIMIN